MQVPSPASPAHAGSAGTCPAAIPGERSPADALAYQLIRVSKLLRVIRSEAPRAHPAVDGTAYPMLFNLAGGPLRISTLAERTHVEVSNATESSNASLTPATAGPTCSPSPTTDVMRSVRCRSSGRNGSPSFFAIGAPRMSPSCANY